MKTHVILVLLLSAFIVSCTDLTFNSEKWKNWEIRSSENHLRWDMTDDLVENYGLVGKTRNEILLLLGKPDNNIDGTENELFYDLGPCRRGIDYGALLIYFKNDTVYKVEKHCH